MPSTNISLEAALAAARREDIATADFLHDLVRDIRTGEIKASCAELVKANLRLIHERRNLKDAIDAIHLSEQEKTSAFETLSCLTDTVRHYWFAEGYYTFNFIDGWVEVYSYGDFHHKFKGGELNSDFMAFAWVDIERHVILCDDIENRSRFEYAKVEINRLDFDRFIGRKPQLAPKTRGPKRRLYNPDVEQRAILLLKQNPGISRTQYRDKVVEWLGSEIGETQFQEYYGKHWTENNNRRKALGI